MKLIHYGQNGNMIHSIIEQLADTPGRNDKIAILKENDYDGILPNVLSFALDPYKQFYIKKIPEYTPIGGTTLLKAMKELKKLSEREVTGNAASDHLAKILSSLDLEDALVIEKIIKKDLRCGVQASTVNKVWPKLIPSYPVLLASPFKQKLVDQVVWPAYAQHKLDGMRANITVVDGQVSICGRSGKPIDLLGTMDEAMREYDFIRQLIVPMNGCVYDGELIMLEPDGSVMSRKKGNGIINKGIKGTLSAEEASRIRVVLWDMIPHNEFKAEKCNTPYEIRWGWLESVNKSSDVMDPLRPTTKLFQLAETRIVENFEEAVAYFQEMLYRGQEGIILKTFQAIWENKRSKGLIKFKAEEDVDLIVTDWTEGTGRLEGMLGSMQCESSDGRVQVSIGTGFSDEDRVKYTKEYALGRIVAIVYNERISSKTDKPDSLFLPRFIEFREDKAEPDHSSTIK